MEIFGKTVGLLLILAIWSRFLEAMRTLTMNKQFGTITPASSTEG